MAAGLTDKLMDMTDIATMVEESAPKPKRSRHGTRAERAERGRLLAEAAREANEIAGVKGIIRAEWSLPPDLLPEELTAFAKELRDRIRRGDTKDTLYIRASLVQVHDMRLPIARRSQAHRDLIDRVYAFLGGL